MSDPRNPEAILVPETGADCAPDPVLDGVVEGTAGADLIDAAYTGDPEGDMIDGGDAIDPAAGPDDDVVSAGDGADTVAAGAGDDSVWGGAGDDVIDGGAGDDTLVGGSGADTVTGGTGDDLIMGDGNDNPGGDNAGEVIFETEEAGFINVLGIYQVDPETGEIFNVQIAFPEVNLASEGGPLNPGDSFAYDMGAGATVGTFIVTDGFSLNNLAGLGAGSFVFENAAGGTAVLGDATPVLVHIAEDGTRTEIDGATYHSAAFGDNAAMNPDGLVHVRGLSDNGDGSFTIGFEDLPDLGDQDFDDPVITVRLTEGSTLLTPDLDATNDPDDGAPGDDVLDGGDGDDTIDGGEGDDTITGGDGDDSVTGGDGDDDIDTSGPDAAPDRGGPGVDPDEDPENDRDWVDGGDGNDNITTGDDRDTITGGAGDDTIDSGIDDDLVDGGAGNDVITGGEGNDTVDGGAGDDIIDTSGPDHPSFDAPLPDRGFPPLVPADADPDNDRDLVFGGDGNDLIATGDDNDTIDGGAGNDTIWGGLDPSLPDALNIPDATDPVPDNGRDLIDGGDGNDVIFGQDDDDTIFGGAGDDTIDAGIDDDVVDGGAGNDVITGGDGTDTLSGGDDRDTFLGATDGDEIHGGSGGDDFDRLDLTGQGPFRLVDVVTDSDGNGIDGTVEFLDGDDNVIGSAIFTNIEEIVPCFTPGTAIATPRGEVAVQDLKVGDLVVTRDNGLQPIRWIGRKTLDRRALTANPHLKPILIRAGSLGQGLPERDIMVSPNHRMLVANERTALYFAEHEVLVAAKHLVNHRGVHEIDPIAVTYIHFMFDRHEVVLADGAWSESFQPGDYTLKGLGNAQRNEILELFPDLVTPAGREAYGSVRKTLKRFEARLLG